MSNAVSAKKRAGDDVRPFPQPASFITNTLDDVQPKLDIPQESVRIRTNSISGLMVYYLKLSFSVLMEGHTQKLMRVQSPASVLGLANSDKLSAAHLHANAILTGLDAGEFAKVLAAGILVHLKVPDHIYHPDEEIKDVYFPIDCVLSVVTRMRDGNQIEVGTIGREGVSAIPLLLGATTSANESYCQIPGFAIRIDAGLFQQLKLNVYFQKLLNRYVQAYVNMLGQLAGCNRLHTVYERCARWLLMSQDRVESSKIHLTHEYLAMMLGTRRSGVTVAAGILQRADFIRYGKGIITITDRPGLEGASCECYEVAREQFGGFLTAIEEHRAKQPTLLHR